MTTTTKSAPTRKTVKKAAVSKAVKAPRTAKAALPRMTLAETMSTLEKAGSEQTRKTYARHGATGQMFGVSFATLKALLKRIGVDHELALALWDTGNLDARNLAVKIADPARMSVKDLDRWAGVGTPRSPQACGNYVAHVAAEGPHAHDRAAAWLAARDEARRATGWVLVSVLAMRAEDLPDSWFTARLGELERSLQSAPNAQRESMLSALIAIGCRNAALRKSATAAAKKIGRIEIDHGDTACKTPEFIPTIEKTWAYAASKGFATPAAQERARESVRLRC